MDKSIKSYTLFKLLVFLIMTHSVFAQQPYILDKVIANVGNEYILFSDVEEEFSYARTRNPNVSEEVKCNILDGLIAQKLIVHQAKLDSIEVSEDEVESHLNMRFQSILQQMNNDEEFFKSYYGASISEMKEKYRDDQKEMLLAQRMQDKLIRSVDITPKEVIQYFHSIPADSLPYLDSEVEIGEIIIFPKVNPDERQKTIDFMQMIKEQLDSGEATFEELARRYSQDGAAEQGGDLGFAARGNYVPEFEAIAFTLDPGEVSDVVETEFGFHIIKQVERRGLSVRVKHIIRKPEITSDDLQLALTKADSIRKMINSGEMDFITAVRRFSDPKTMSYNNAGRVTNRYNNTTFFETKELDPDIYFAIIDLKTGEVSEPIESTDPRKGTFYQLIQLQSIKRPHRASLELDYDKVSYFAKESKKSEYFANWITKKMEETFISIDRSFAICPDLIRFIE